MVATAPSIRVVRMPNLHTGQQEVRRSVARFRVLACGRRWGKTLLGAVLCLAEALQGRRAWWVGPSYPVASVGWRAIKRLAQQLPGCETREVDRQVLLPNGGWVQVRSADNPNSLRGEGLDFVVMDEAAFIQEQAWTEALRPTLADRQGRAMFISTPNGLNWFWQLWQRGETHSAEWASWQKPTADNPYIPVGEIEAARESLPERVFEQEFLAQFLEDGAGVFRRVREAATSDGIGKGPFCIGADWGQSNDFSVFSVVDLKERKQVALDRSNRVEYLVQEGRLAALCQRYPPALIVAEANAMGRPIIERLQRRGLPVFAWTASNATKAQVVQDLALAFEQSNLKILPDATQLAELQAYQAERLPSGLIRYTAPEGMHDDTVVALALAWQGTRAARPARAREFRFEEAE